eukprot:1800786-Rhodomonas_salina.1
MFHYAVSGTDLACLILLPASTCAASISNCLRSGEEEEEREEDQEKRDQEEEEEAEEEREQEEKREQEEEEEEEGRETRWRERYAPPRRQRATPGVRAATWSARSV